MFERYLFKFLPFTILPIAIISVQHYSSAPIGSTTMYWIVFAIVLLAFWGASKVFFDERDTKNFRVVKWFLIWNISTIVYGGLFMSNNYWDYKNLINMGMALLMPIIAYGASNKLVLQSILSLYLKYTLPLIVVFIPFLPPAAYGWYLFPISLILFFLPAIKFQWKALVVFVALFGALANLSARSHVFKFIFPILLVGSFYYLRFIFTSDKYMKIVRLVLLIAPFFFFSLAVSGIFNVFKMNEYIEGLNQKNEQDADPQPLNQDSRTFLYEEVLSSAMKHNYWLMGRTPARGNDTKVFVSKDGSSLTGRRERVQNEANILNILTWTGIIGVMLYFFVFIKASYLAIYRSRNVFVKLIGVFVAFRWAYAWVEDYSSFDLNNYVIWLMIGCCLSTSFRMMTNDEVFLWARGIFGKKYRTAYRKLYFDHATN